MKYRMDCPYCQKEIGDEMEEGWFCEECGHVYSFCWRCDNGKCKEFISASVPEEDVSGYGEMMKCQDSKIEELTKREARSFDGELPEGNVVIVNKVAGLCYANVGKGNGLSEPACYIWKCNDCGQYSDTCSD